MKSFVLSVFILLPIISFASQQTDQITQKEQSNTRQLIPEQPQSLNGQLFAAIRAANPNIDAIQGLLDRGAQIDVQNNYGWTPLHYAIVRGHENIVRLLLNYGANPNAQDKVNKTPFDIATDCKHTAAAHLLELWQKEALKVCRI